MPKNPTAGRNDPAARIRGALKARGSSLNAWALAHGYPVRTVYSCVETWAGRTDRDPLGGISRRIMTQLRADLGDEIVPPVRRQAA